MLRQGSLSSFPSHLSLPLARQVAPCLPPAPPSLIAFAIRIAPSTSPLFSFSWRRSSKQPLLLLPTRHLFSLANLYAVSRPLPSLHALNTAALLAPP
ncbi:hypothetical protein Scep_015081 [Stephania cephalantha]|uniref:Uncharacterized protein n=1 Tax=Stephania cephalantha TaxID=152367 RepID=A0AAP0P2G7_9MAGN